MPRLKLLPALLVIPALGLAVAACGGDDNGQVSGVEPLPDSSCAEVEFGGDGDADVLIASDLPMQGDSAERSEQMVAAIREVLDREDWQAGDTKVAFQACDDSIEETGEWDEARCRENAEAYAANPDVVGVIGTYNSGCALEMVPILNEAPDGGVAMVSPGNTLICLTQNSPQCDPDEPKGLYPSGDRSYARVVPNDAAQGAGLAQFAQDQGITSPFILYAADDETSQGQADTFRAAATELGLDLAGYDIWDPDAPDYDALMDRVEESDADGLLLAGLLDQNGAQLIEDKVNVLGDNEEMPLLAPDGFAQQATIDEAGDAATGMFVSVPGRVPKSLKGPGKELVAALREEAEGEPVELFAPYAGQAAEVLLGVLADGSERSEVVEGLTGYEVEGGIVGNFRITDTGDPSVTPISISVAEDAFELETLVTPERELVTAAREG